MYDDLFTVLSIEIIRKIINSKPIRAEELGSIVSALVKANIPFDLDYRISDKIEPPQTLLSIYFKPLTKLEIAIVFDKWTRLA